MIIKRLFIKPIFAWYDLWVGAYIDILHKSVYILPLPMVGVKIRLLPERDMTTDSLCLGCGWVGHHIDLREGYEPSFGYTGPTHCPECGSDDITGYSVEFDIHNPDHIPF